MKFSDMKYMRVDTLETGKEFEALRNNPEYEKLCQRVKALIVIKPKGE